MNTRLLLTPLLASLAATVTAAERFWDGGDATANWTVAANWDGNTVLNLATDDLNFPSGLAIADKTVNNNYAANTVFRTLNFLDGGYTVNGTIMGLTNGISGFFNSGSVVLNASFSAQNAQTFAVNGGGDLLFAGQIFLNNHTLNIQPIHADSTISIGGVLAGSMSSVLRVTGDGIAYINGAKVFDGGVTIENGGELNIDNSGGLGTGTRPTTIDNGRLVLDNVAPLVVPESILMVNADPDSSEIVSRGGAHTISGGIEFSGDHFKRFIVEGTSLTLSGAISGPSSFGAMRKLGSGSLTLSGAANNTFGIQIFSAYEGLVFLNKSGGATAISSPFVLVGNNGAPANSAIVRLGASDQINDGAQVHIARDGWFDLNGRAETIEGLVFQHSGRATTGAGELRVDDYVWAFGSTSIAPATFTGNLVLGGADVEWDIYDGVAEIELIVTGGVTSLLPDGKLTKIGDGSVAIYGPVDVPLLQVNTGDMLLSGQSPATEASVTGGRLYAAGTLGEITATGGQISIGLPSADGNLACGDVNLAAPASMQFSFTSAAPGQHDQVNVVGTVTLSDASWGIQFPGLDLTVPGDEIVFINNDGADPIVGQFNFLPEGQVFGNFYYSYQGGDGNDFSMTRIVPPTGVTRLWDGGSAVDDNWMTAANWNPNGVPQPGDALVFPTVASRKFNNNNFPAGTTFHSLTVHGTGYGLGGNGILLNEKVEFTSASGSHFLSLPITLALNATISLTGDGFIQAGDPIILNGKTLTLHNAGGGTGDLYISGDLTGAGAVRKTGPGRITYFEQPNSYAGPTDILEGTLAVKADATLGATGAANGTTIHTGATLLIRNNEGGVNSNETITLYGTIRDTAGAAFIAQLNGPLVCAADTATIAADGDLLNVNGVISGPGQLHKTGPGLLAIGGNQANTFTAGLFVDEGETNLRKFSGNAVPFASVGATGLPAKLSLGWVEQVADTGTVTLAHPSAVFAAGGANETLDSIIMYGGTVTGDVSEGIRLNSLVVAAGSSTAVVSARLRTPIAANGVLQVADGPASPDLRIDGILYGGTFEKTGTGRADFTAEIPLDGLDLLDLKQGSGFFFNNCRYTAIYLNGGLLGGNGTVGNISSIAGGTVSPGVSPGVLGGNIGTWNAATTLRMELNGLNPGAEYDQYFVNSDLNLGNARLDLSANFDPAPGAEFMLVRNVGGSPISGTFAGIPQNGFVSTPGAKVFQIDYAGGDGDDVVLTRVDVKAPEIVKNSMAPGVDDHKGENEIDVTVLGTPGLTYQLETSTDLQSWTFQQSIMADLPDGLMHFEFFNQETDPRLFLRVRLP